MPSEPSRETLQAAVAEATVLQASLFDFAISELVRQHRTSFAPLWSAESWAKLLIWLSLNCGCSGDEASLTAFAEALGPRLTRRLRQVFFERELDQLALRVLADPADPQVLVLPLDPAHADLSVSGDCINEALQQVQLSPLLPADPSGWRYLEAAVAIPWGHGVSGS